MNATIRFINLTNYLLGDLFFSKNRVLHQGGPEITERAFIRRGGRNHMFP
jgi:hypothetical protein